MRTRITELFGIEHPIVLSGMSWVSVPDLVAAVSNGGGLGLLATGALSAAETRTSIRQIRELTNRPFGANVSLMLPGASENARVLLEEQVPVINFSLGKGDWLVKAAHQYGGKVVATVTTVQHAVRAQNYGTDAVIATGHEAAGHGGLATSLVLVPYLVDRLNIPVIAAGGFGDARGLVAALALGADAIAMGTRFMMTRESVMHPNLKAKALEKDVHGTVYSTRFDGMNCRMMDNAGTREAMRHGLRWGMAWRNGRHAAAEKGENFWRLLFSVLGSGWKNARQMAYFANSFKLCRDALEGDAELGWMPLGQVAGLIDRQQTVSEVMEEITAGASRILTRMNEKLQQEGGAGGAHPR